MSESPRRRRSALYVPGANARALDKAKTFPADVLILDLEDAVLAEVKLPARELVCAAAAGSASGQQEIAIRINGLNTVWHDDDLRAVAVANPAAVLVPKVNSAKDVLAVEHALEKLGAPAHLQIWAMLETPIAVLRAAEIVSSSERLTVLVMGTNDLANELHAEHVPGRQPLLFALSACLAAVRSAGKVILDGVYNDIHDRTGLEAECLQGRQFGMDGKTLIHPSQVEPCNRLFSPRDEEVEQARRIIAAFEAARAAGKGVVALDGRMIENLHVENARRILALAEAIVARPDETD